MEVSSELDVFRPKLLLVQSKREFVTRVNQLIPSKFPVILSYRRWRQSHQHRDPQTTALTTSSHLQDQRHIKGALMSTELREMPGVKRHHDGVGKETEPRASPFMPMFEVFRTELDEHHDRRERIIKASRDITAASKKM